MFGLESVKKPILTSDLFLERVDLTLQAPDLHLPVGAERPLARLVLQGLHGLRRLCDGTFREHFMRIPPSEHAFISLGHLKASSATAPHPAVCVSARLSPAPGGGSSSHRLLWPSCPPGCAGHPGPTEPYLPYPVPPPTVAGTPGQIRYWGGGEKREN